MDVTYSMVTPREFEGTHNSCYNPWLEARFVNGMASNCMTCHQRAVYTDNNAQMGSVFPFITGVPPNGGIADDDSYFAEKTKLDFFWSILLESK